MKLTNTLFIMLLCICFSNCAPTKLVEAETLGEQNSTFSYIPLDPLPVATALGYSCNYPPYEEGKQVPFKSLLNSFPDQTVRLSIAKIEKDGSITYGSIVKASGEDQTYEVTLDYINVDVTQIPFFYREKYEYPEPVKTETDSIKERKIVYQVEPSVRFRQYNVSEDEEKVNLFKQEEQELKDSLKILLPGKGWQEKVVPVYIGVGLRVVARVTTLKGDVNLSGLGVIASEAKAGKLKGSLSVQTLGITGKSVSSALPLPSEINETTIQNAILAIGTIKAQLYANSVSSGEGNETANKDIVITPRVVGIYKSFKGGPEVINPIISELARKPILWYRPCNKIQTYQTTVKD